MVGVTDPHGHILAFPDRIRYVFFQAAPQLYSRDWVDPIPDPLLLRNQTQTSGSVARNSAHYTMHKTKVKKMCMAPLFVDYNLYMRVINSFRINWQILMTLVHQEHIPFVAYLQ
jgi:hypothetical protein